jgi:hypothetical protein
VRLLGQILANGLVERVHTRRPDRPAAAGTLGLGRLGWAARRVGKAGQAGPTGWISAQESISNKKLFFFFKSVYELQINLNLNKI